MLVASRNIKIMEKKVNNFRRKIQLRIKQTTEETFQSYLCVAKNTIGKTRERIDVFGKRG